MKQPALGKKIVELRKNQGFTQEELVERCNISVRTLQRIESGEVTPRSHTLKLIFEVLEYRPANKINKFIAGLSEIKSQLNSFLSKPKVMKRTIIILAALLAVSLTLLAFKRTNPETDSDIESARKAIEKINEDYKRWYNNGHIDSCITTFSEDVCLVNNWIILKGKQNVYYQLLKVQPQGYKIMDGTIETFHRDGNLAVVSGTSATMTPSGDIIVGKYLEEWQFVDGKWLKVNDIESQH